MKEDFGDLLKPVDSFEKTDLLSGKETNSNVELFPQVSEEQMEEQMKDKKSYTDPQKTNEM